MLLILILVQETLQLIAKHMSDFNQALQFQPNLMDIDPKVQEILWIVKFPTPQGLGLVSIKQMLSALPNQFACYSNSLDRPTIMFSCDNLFIVGVKSPNYLGDTIS